MLRVRADLLNDVIGLNFIMFLCFCEIIHSIYEMYNYFLVEPKLTAPLRTLM